MTLRVFSYGGGAILAAQLGKCYTVCNEIISPGGAGNAPGVSTQEVIPVAVPQYTRARRFPYSYQDMTIESQARFWEKVEAGSNDACWPWKGKPNGKGYGRFGYMKTVILAHRLACESAHGRLQSGQYALHKCDNPICCNPRHLFKGTITDNNRDMFRKGRGKIPHRVNRTSFDGINNVGQDHPRAKLTWEQVRAIRAVPTYRGVLTELARQYGVSIPVVDAIRKGRTWKER